MQSKEVKKFFVVGIGNPLRCDDGLGSLIAGVISKRKIPGVKVITSLQLNLELLEEAVGYLKILIIDASVTGEGIVFKKIQSPGNALQSSSHHLSPELFLAMGKELYDKDLSLYLCSIRGQNFDLGDTFSSQVMESFPHAIIEIDAFLKE